MIVWKFDEKELYCRFVLHKVKVQALAFSPSDHYLATLGGLDDGRWAPAPSGVADGVQLCLSVCCSVSASVVSECVLLCVC